MRTQSSGKKSCLTLIELCKLSMSLSLQDVGKCVCSYLLLRGELCGWKWTPSFRWWRHIGTFPRLVCCASSGPRGWRAASHREGCFVSRLKPGSWRCRLSSTRCVPAWSRRCGPSSWVAPSCPGWPACPGAPPWTKRGWRAVLLNLEDERGKQRCEEFTPQWHKVAFKTNLRDLGVVCCWGK